MHAALAHLEAHRDAAVEDLRSFLAIPSVSTQKERANDCRRAAEWVEAKMRDAGLDVATVHETGGHPIVTGAWRKADGRPTVLIYGHYDVQPPEPLDKWDSPPFEPTVRDGRIYARGATDDKGQLLVHLQAVEAILATADELPVNVVFCIEGEEEVSSTHLDQFIVDNADRLAADVALISDTAMWNETTPALVYGLRGICTYDVRVTGPASDLHSGVHGGAVTNPAEALARILAAMKDDKGRVTIPGFYDDVRKLTKDERAEWAELDFDESAYRDELGVDAMWGEKGYTALERRTARPTFEVNGIGAGYQGDGFKTVLPSEATAKVSVRLVPDQDPAKIDAAVAKAIGDAAPPGVRVEVTPHVSGRPELVPRDSPALQLAADALEATYGTRPVFIREGGSIPVVSMLRQRLDLPVVLMGFGMHDENLHAPNEFFRLDNYHKGAEASVRYLHGARDLNRA